MQTLSVILRREWDWVPWYLGLKSPSVPGPDKRQDITENLMKWEFACKLEVFQESPLYCHLVHYSLTAPYVYVGKVDRNMW